MKYNLLANCCEPLLGKQDNIHDQLKASIPPNKKYLQANTFRKNNHLTEHSCNLMISQIFALQHFHLHLKKGIDVPFPTEFTHRKPSLCANRYVMTPMQHEPIT